jgi:hypothetical protein
MCLSSRALVTMRPSIFSSSPFRLILLTIHRSLPSSPLWTASIYIYICEICICCKQSRGIRKIVLQFQRATSQHHESTLGSEQSQFHVSESTRIWLFSAVDSIVVFQQQQHEYEKESRCHCRGRRRRRCLSDAEQFGASHAVVQQLERSSF